MRKINGFFDEKKLGIAGNIAKGVLEHDGRLSKCLPSGDEEQKSIKDLQKNMQTYK